MKSEPTDSNPALQGRRAHGLDIAAVGITLLATLFSGHAAAGTWRCGNTYTDRPCDGGSRLELSDPRTIQDRLAADAATQRLSAEADRMERERLAFEQGIDPSPHGTARPAGRRRAMPGPDATKALKPKPEKEARRKSGKADRQGRPGVRPDDFIAYAAPASGPEVSGKKRAKR